VLTEYESAMTSEDASDRVSVCPRVNHTASQYAFIVGVDCFRASAKGLVSHRAVCVKRQATDHLFLTVDLYILAFNFAK
jgi:hypothetical protein